MAPERPSVEDSSGVPVAHVFSLNTNAMLVKEGEGILIEEQVGAEEDDDLTSLSWLVQSKNLLKGINLKPGVTQASPTSDFAEDGSSSSERSERGDSLSSCSIEPQCSSSGCADVTFMDVDHSVIQSVKTPKLKHPHHIPYDPLIHVNSKPPYSFSCLIFMAIEDSPARALPVKEIYAWIQSHFPFYRNAPTGWKNSVRHNLSLNKCFCKVEKAPNLGKGSLWMVDPAFRPNLLQSMSKAPINSLTFLERSSAKNLINSNGLPSKSHGNNPKYVNGNKSKLLGRVSRLPNPELFPFLSRRLAASGVEVPGVNRYDNMDGESEDEEDDEDDVDAAEAMLSLKHGPRIILPKTEDIYKRSYVRKMNSQRTRKSSTPVITSSPSEDHTYSAGVNMSPDEAYGEASDTDDGTEITPGHPSLPDESNQSDSEEQRRVAEGAADALLNLAGIRPKQIPSVEISRNRPRPSSSSEITSPERNRRRRSHPHRSNLDSPRQQQLRSIRKREKLALEQEIQERKNLTKAEILADLAVIQNNNNIVLTEEAYKNLSHPAGSLQTRPVKLKRKRQLISSSKPNIDVTSTASAKSDSSMSSYQLDKKLNPLHKRSHWSHESKVRKSRR